MAMEKSGILVGVIKVSKEVSKDKLGVKRICGSCGAKFYDLGKTPIICPKCGTPYEEIASPKPSAPVAPVEEAPEVEDIALETDEAAEADDVEVRVVENGVALYFSAVGLSLLLQLHKYRCVFRIVSTNFKALCMYFSTLF